jgi:putative ABC transport system ATP-binding protein
MALLQALNRDGMTIVVVTHEPDVAQHAGRVLTFRDGRVVRDERVAAPRDAAAALAELPRSVEDAEDEEEALA